MTRRSNLAWLLGALGLISAASATPAAAPAAPVVVYTLDAAKSTLNFGFVQAGAKNTGRFPKFTVNFSFADDNLAASKLDVGIDVSALNSDDQERDDTLRGADLFNIAKFPQAHFTATQISKSAAGYEAAGTLNLRGVTRPQRVSFTLRSANEQGRAVLYMTGKALVKRLDFGVGQGDWKSTEWIDNDVNITFNLRLIPQG
jgi:polyisoprenoid-binding protein YceI